MRAWVFARRFGRSCRRFALVAGAGFGALQGASRRRRMFGRSGCVFCGWRGGAWRGLTRRRSSPSGQGRWRRGYRSSRRGGRSWSWVMGWRWLFWWRRSRARVRHRLRGCGFFCGRGNTGFWSGGPGGIARWAAGGGAPGALRCVDRWGRGSNPEGIPPYVPVGRGGWIRNLAHGARFARICRLTRFRPQASTDLHRPSRRPGLGNSRATADAYSSSPAPSLLGRSALLACRGWSLPLLSRRLLRRSARPGPLADCR